MATQLNDWLSIDKISGTGNAEITLTASSYTELVDRAASIKIQAQSTNAILNVRQKAYYIPIEKNNNYFWIEFENTGGEVSSLKHSWTDIYYSFDAKTWTAVDSTGVVSLNTKRLVYLKNKTKTLISRYADGALRYIAINFNSNAKIGGDLSSMTNMEGSCCERLFKDNIYLTDASALILPWDTLDNSCYCYMFEGCSSLTKAPVLPATTLAGDCYSHMFSKCSSLTIAPELPITTLVNTCYGYMFEGCSSLTKAPILPATTLAEWCYYSMFSGCSSLTKAPELPATTLAEWCYAYMFAGCSNLTTVPELPVTTLTERCYYAMFKDCKSLTIAPSLPAITLTEGCYSNMFAGCKSLTTAPSLPSTTLAPDCYATMFGGCTSLKIAPALPAITLASECYLAMFNGCTSITIAPELPASNLYYNCYLSMFDGCTSLNYIKMLAKVVNSNYLKNWVRGVATTGTFIKHPDANLTKGVNGIPKGWTVETATE